MITSQADKNTHDKNSESELTQEIKIDVRHIGSKNLSDNADFESENQNGNAVHACAISRRSFLLSSAAATATFTVMVNMPGSVSADTIPATVATFPKKLIARLSQLQNDVPVTFNYPDDKQYSVSMLVKLGREAGGGIGPDSDVVAFSYTCTHQGGPMMGTYKSDHKVLGPCPLHLTTYDMTRHGIVVSGNAYQSLPQVLLELDGDDIYAVGVFGLIYGRYDNLQG